MTLSAKDLSKLIVGATHTEETAQGFLAARRFTEKQTAYYKATNTDFYNKTFATSGVRVAMTTDAKEIRFAYRANRASSRTFFFIDMCVDGKLVAHEGKTDVEAHEGEMTFVLPEGTHKVELYLPNLFDLQIGSMELVDATKAEPVKKKYRMLALGDSITQGYDAQFSSLSYVNITADRLDATVVDQAIGGEIFNPGIIDGELGFTPDFITVAYGSNDYAKSTREEMILHANEFYSRVRATFPHAKIFAMLPLWRGDLLTKPRIFGTFAEAKEVVRAAAAVQPNTVIIDCEEFVPPLLNFFTDFGHPNDLGFQFYARALVDAIKPHLN